MIEYLRSLGLVFGVIAVYAVGYPLDPIHYQGITGNDRAPNTHEEINAVGRDIDMRTDVGDSVLVVMPVWIHESDRRMPMHTPRWYYAADNNHGQELGWNDTSWATNLKTGIASRLRTGKIGMIIMTPRTHTVLARWESARRAFKSNFCKVRPRPDVYEQWDISIFVYKKNQPRGCVVETQWPWDLQLARKKSQ